MPTLLQLPVYRTAIALDDPPQIKLDAKWRELLKPVLQELGAATLEQMSTDEAVDILHGLLAPIDENVLSESMVARIETIAAGVNSQQQTVDSLTLPRIKDTYRSSYSAAAQTSIWVGDILQLGVDAIVNAANSYLLGCRVPNHACIDNSIHSAAGPRLRDDCAAIIKQQAAQEPAGAAKITRGYALRAKYVLHTVGPQLHPGSQPGERQQNQLQSVYRSCLDVAAEVEDIRSIAFCAISTGLFGYPKPEAAKIALSTVADWLETHPERFDRIIFNLYSAQDAHIYERVING